MALKYQRILLKISGEALGGEKGMGFDEPTMDATMPVLIFWDDRILMRH